MSNPSVDYQCVLQDLKARRDRLNAAIEAVEHILGELQPVPIVIQKASIPVVEPSNNGSDIYRKMTIKDAIIYFLRSSGGKQPAVTVVQALKDGGIRSKSKKLYSTVYNSMDVESKKENGQIIRTDDKMWDLRKRE
ncbi:MAG: hypothetical protein ABSF71_24365 [Terriglobia bacterium]|jgi:NADPH-dependent 7-cyano-7-deazaguanine reductase QueF-like protein